MKHNNRIENWIIPNGIEGATGTYASKMTLARFEKLAANWLTQSDLDSSSVVSHHVPYRGLKEGILPGQLEQTGWGMIFHARDPRREAILEALDPLINLRSEQAGARFRIFDRAEGYRPGESKYAFLKRHGISPGLVDPRLGMPYYLLIVGAPETISYDFQYQMDVQFAVGRIHFKDLVSYEHYARGVVAAETDPKILKKKTAFFGPANPDDRATQLSVKHLVRPLYDQFLLDHPDWKSECYLNELASRTRLDTLLNTKEKPGLLFSASHGMVFPKGDRRQRLHQGALLCGEWPGPLKAPSEIPETQYFSGEHLNSAGDVRGLIAFFFACYSAGTSLRDPFFLENDQDLAENPFLANLPCRLLGHRGGGALAVVGHVDRTWSYSFYSHIGGGQIADFQTTISRLMKGIPLGHAMECFNQRYCELASDLRNHQDHIQAGIPFDRFELAAMRAAHYDARNYLIIGDPAVRLCFDVNENTCSALDSQSQDYSVRRKQTGSWQECVPPEGIPSKDWADTPQFVKDFLGTQQKRISHLEAQLKLKKN